MKSLMKAVSAVLIVSSVAVAATVISKEAVNKNVEFLVAPMLDENTKIDVRFTDLNVDAVRALDFGLEANFYKKGAVNELTLQLANWEYHYGNGSQPTAQGTVSLQSDLVKALGQQFVNELATDLSSFVENAGKSFGEKYGEALALEAKMSELTKDANGNVVSVKVSIKANVDFAKLPQNLKVEDVEFKSFVANISASPKHLTASVQVGLNPANKSFAKDQTGLKEYIDKLLSEDAETYETVQSLIAMLNGFATEFVNTQGE